MITFKFLRFQLVVCVPHTINELVTDILLNITSQEDLMLTLLHIGSRLFELCRKEVRVKKQPRRPLKQRYVPFPQLSEQTIVQYEICIFKNLNKSFITKCLTYFQFSSVASCFLTRYCDIYRNSHRELHKGYPGQIKICPPYTHVIRKRRLN